jgi:hypothetical protein
MDSTQSAPSANDSSSDARLDRAMSADGHALATLARFDCATSANQHALARFDEDQHALARLDEDQHALARLDADQHALAGLDCATSADQHALARFDADGHALATLARSDTDGHALATLARLDAGARRVEWTRGPVGISTVQVQFEASEEYVELVERAKALLSHRDPRLDFADLHLRAMRASWPSSSEK